MPRPRKHQINNPQTKYTKFEYVDSSAKLGQSVWTLTGADYASFTAAMVTPGPGGVEADIPAVIFGAYEKEPFTPWLVPGKRFRIQMPTVNSGAPVTVTFLLADMTTIGVDSVLTAAAVVNRINTTLAAIVGTPPGAIVASRDEAGRVVLTSSDTTGFTYGDSAQITVTDLDVGVCQALGLVAPGDTTLTMNGVTAPKRGVVTLSPDRFGGVVSTRFGNGAPAVTRTNSVKYVGLASSGAPVYMPNIVGGKKITTRLTHDSITPAWVLTNTAPGTNMEIRSFGARIMDVLATDRFTITFNYDGIFGSVTVGSSGPIPSGPNMAAVAGFINGEWDTQNGTGHAICHGQNAEPFNFDGEVLGLELNGVTYAVTFPPAGPKSISDVVTAINTSVSVVVASSWVGPNGNQLKIMAPGATLGDNSVVKILPGDAAKILGLPPRKHTGVEVAFTDGEELVLKCPGMSTTTWSVANVPGHGTPLSSLGITTLDGVLPVASPAPLFNARDVAESLPETIRWLVPESMAYGDIPTMEDPDVVRELTEQANIHIDPTNAADQAGQPLFAQMDGSFPDAWNLSSGLIGYTNSLTPFNTALGQGAGGAGGSHATGVDNAFFGYGAGISMTTGTNNVVIGHGAAPVATTIASNVVIGKSAGNGLTDTSHDSVIIGEEAGYKFTNGCFLNVVVGTQAGYNLTGQQNVAIGYQAAYGSGVGSGANNVAIGSYSLYSVSTGGANIAIGDGAIGSLTTGIGNIGIGLNTLSSNNTSYNICVGNNVGSGTTGNQNVIIGVDAASDGGGAAADNVVVGYQAAYRINDGTRNVVIGKEANYNGDTSSVVAIGADALYSQNNVAGAGIVAIGDSALYSYNTSTALSGCVAVGFEAARNVTLGANHTVVGYQSALGNTGTRCTVVGYSAASSNKGDNLAAIGYQSALSNSGSDSVAIGFQSAIFNKGNNAIAIGHQAAYDNEGANCVAIGPSAAYSNAAGAGNVVAIGPSVAYSNSAYDVVAIGNESAHSNTGNNCVAIGFQPAHANSGVDVVAIGNSAATHAAPDTAPDNSGNECVAIGTNALGKNTGSYCVAIGYKAAYHNDGAGCIAIGNYAARYNPGIDCIAIGNNAADGVVSGDYCVAIGYSAAEINTSDYTVAVGYNAAQVNTGDYLVAVGHQAASDNTGSDVVAVGTGAAMHNHGGNNIAIGRLAAHNNSTTATGRVAIGYRADDPSSLTAFNGNNTVAIGSFAYCNSGDDSISIGHLSICAPLAANGIAIGHSAASSNIGAVAMGTNTDASAVGAVAIGREAQSTAEESISIGAESTASETYSIAIGSNSTGFVGATATGFSSIAIGSNSGTGSGAYASGIFSIAIGGATAATAAATASGIDSVAIGREAQSTAEESISIGSESTASETYSIAIGANAASSDISSVAIGGGITGAQATGSNSISIGRSDATGRFAVAIGYATVRADYSIALGYDAHVTVDQAIQIGTGTNSSTNTLYVGNGSTHNCYAYKWWDASDVRIKTNIQGLSSSEGLTFVEALRPVSYELKHPASDQQRLPCFGLIAQEVKQTIVDAGLKEHGIVTEGEIWALDYNQFVAPLIKAVQELSGMVKSLQAEVADLKKKVG